MQQSIYFVPLPIRQNLFNQFFRNLLFFLMISVIRNLIHPTVDTITHKFFPITQFSTKNRKILLALIFSFNCFLYGKIEDCDCGRIQCTYLLGICAEISFRAWITAKGTKDNCL